MHVTTVRVVQAIPLHHFIQRHGPGLPRAKVDESLLGDVEVLQVVEVFLDGLDPCRGSHGITCLVAVRAAQGAAAGTHAGVPSSQRLSVRARCSEPSARMMKSSP